MVAMAEPPQPHRPSGATLEALELALSFLGGALERDRPLAPLCTYRVGGNADLFVEVADSSQLESLARALSRTTGPDGDLDDLVNVIGRGSNLLVADGGVRGLVIQLGESFGEVSLIERCNGGVTVRVGAAATMPVAARRIAAMGITGFEWAVGIPGSIGGAVRMNAGGHGSDLAEVLVRVHLVDLGNGKALWMDADELHLAYRSSDLLPQQVVTAVDLSLGEGDVEDANRRLSEIVRWRRENQPGGPNAGSVFTNPPGDSAGRLIDTAGCRGLRIGTAEVSRKHANFIQADPGGSADDVMALMKEIVRRVRDHHGVTLHAETVLLGFPDTDVAEVKGSGEDRRR